MVRRLVLVDIEADTPLEAEQIVGGALAQRLGRRRYYYARQTEVVLSDDHGPFRPRKTPDERRDVQ